MSTDEKPYTFEERPRKMKGSAGFSTKTYDVYKVDKSTGATIGKAVVKGLSLAEALRIGATLREWDPPIPEPLEDVTGPQGGSEPRTVEVKNGNPQHEAGTGPRPESGLRFLREGGE